MSSINNFLDKSLPRFFLAYLDRKFSYRCDFVSNLEKKIKLWLKNLFSELVKLVLLVMAVGLIFLGGLYFLRGSWFIFKDTLIGIRYTSEVNPVWGVEITRLLNFDLIGLTSIVITTTIGVSIKTGVISQLLLLRRFFYIGRSIFVKLVWVVFVSFMAAFHVAEYYPIDLRLLFGLCFLPTLCIFGQVLNASGKLLLELDIILFVQNYREKREIKLVRRDIERILAEKAVENPD